MTYDPLEHFKQTSLSVSLTDEEHREILRGLRNTMEREISAPTLFDQWVDSVIDFKNSLAPMRPYAILAVIFIAVVSSAGTGLAAESALPGDLLYPVKIWVTEPAQAALSLSPEAKTDWEIRRAERRLEEAEQLSAEGKLSDEVRKNLGQQFASHLASVNEQREEFIETNLNASSRVSSSLEASLNAHAKILANLEKVRKPEDLNLQSAVSKEIGNANQWRQESEDKLAAQSHPAIEQAAEGRKTAAQNTIDAATGALARSNERGRNTDEAQLKLDEATGSFQTATTLLAAGNVTEAFRTFGDAERLAIEARQLAQATINLGIDLNVNTETRQETNGSSKQETEARTKGKNKNNVE